MTSTRPPLSDVPESEQPLPKARPVLSVAIWIPAIVGITLAVMLTAFATLGHAAQSLPV